jgi:3-oxoacyl-[acyl-carrier protein] reductase
MQTVVTRLATKFNSTFDSLVNQSTQNIPLGRLGKPQDVANYISFLCTEKADFINGTITNIDGGYSVSP